MEGDKCPREQQLSQFLLGTLCPTEFFQVGCHIDSCRGCESIAAALERAGDPLLTQLQAAANFDGYDDEPSLQRAILTVVQELEASFRTRPDRKLKRP